jgi:hypothetical protein
LLDTGVALPDLEHLSPYVFDRIAGLLHRGIIPRALT